METGSLNAAIEVPEQFQRGFWEALLQEYLDQTQDEVTWFGYLNFLEEKGRSPKNLRDCQNGEIWKNQLGILLEIEENNTDCLGVDLWLQDLCENPEDKEEYGARLFKNITGEEPKAKIFFGRRQGYFRFQFDSKADFHAFLREESGKGTIRDTGGFHRQQASLPLNYIDETGQKKRARFIIGTLIVLYSLVDTLEDLGPISNTDVYSAGIDDHERQHWLDGVRKRVLVKAQQNKFRRKITALEEEWGLTEEFPSGLADSYWHIWTEIFAHTRDGGSISKIKSPLYQAHYDALKDAYPDFEANFSALQEVLEGVHGELRALVLAQIQTLPIFSFLKQTHAFLEWEKQKQRMVKETLGTYAYEATYDCVPTPYQELNTALRLAETALNDLVDEIQLATMRSDPILTTLAKSYETQKAECERLKSLFSKDGVPIPRLSDSQFKLPEDALEDEALERRQTYELGTEIANELLAIPQAEVEQHLGRAETEVVAWLQGKNLITSSLPRDARIQIVKNDPTGIEANYEAYINEGRFSVDFCLFRAQHSPSLQ